MKTELVRNSSFASVISNPSSEIKCKFDRTAAARRISTCDPRRRVRKCCVNVTQSIEEKPPKKSTTQHLKEWSQKTFRKKSVYRKIPILGWIQHYNTHKLIADIIAGLTVGLTLLPQGLAYATIAKVPPEMGLYSSFIGSFVYIFFGSTKDVSIGPTAGLAIATLGYTADSTLSRAEYTILVSFLTGLVTLSMGFLQLGFLVNFISLPTLSGFTSAVALTICSTQFAALLGLSFEANGFIEIVDGTISHFSQMRPADTILSIICCVTLLFLLNLQKLIGPTANKISPVLGKIVWFVSTSRSGILVVVCTVVFGILADPSLVRVVGHIPPGLPEPALPPFFFTKRNNETGLLESFSICKLLETGSSLLIVVPLLAIMEHITIAKALAGAGSRVDSSQEMLTIGLSNTISSFFGSIPVTGGFSFTTVNYASGVKTPMGCLATGLTIILSLQFLTPYFYFIPNATLAAVIVCSVIFRMDFAIVRSMWNTKKMDIIPWSGTFLISLLVGLEYGILFGVVVSIGYLLYYTARPGISVEKGESCTGFPFILVHLDRSLVFPSVDYTCYILKKAGNRWADGKLPVVVDCKHIQFADYTAAQGIKDLFVLFNEKKQDLILWRLKPSVVRLVTGVMRVTHTPFRHCSNEAQLEDMLEKIMDGSLIEVESPFGGCGYTNKSFVIGDIKDEDGDSDYDDDTEAQITIVSEEQGDNILDQVRHEQEAGQGQQHPYGHHSQHNK